MKLEDLKTIEQLIDFLSGTHTVAFSVISFKLPLTLPLDSKRIS